MKRQILSILIFAVISNFTIKAQKNWKDNLQIGGFIQTDIEYSQMEGRTNMGKYPTYNPLIDNKDKDYFLRYGVRRGGVRFAYSYNKIQGIFEMDISNMGVNQRLR